MRDAIQQIAVAHRRRYGYRRITAELRRRGLLVNHKRVARLMREDNLLAVQPRAFVVTTDAASRAGGLSQSRQPADVDRDESALGGGHHLHSPAHEFVYLAVMLDAFSRKVVGWALDRTLADAIADRGAGSAITNGSRRPGWCIIPIVAFSMRPEPMCRSCGSTR